MKLEENRKAIVEGKGYHRIVGEGRGF